MMNFTVDKYKVDAMVNGLNEQVIRNVVQTIRKWNFIILNESIEHVNVDRGQLQNSLTQDIFFLANQIVGKVGTNKFYAPYVHGVWVPGKGWVGPRPHFVSFNTAPDLLNWALRKKVAEKINGKIYRKMKNGKLAPIKGIFMTGKVNPFIGNAFDSHVHQIIADLQNAVGGGTP